MRSSIYSEFTPPAIAELCSWRRKKPLAIYPLGARGVALGKQGFFRGTGSLTSSGSGLSNRGVAGGRGRLDDAPLETNGILAVAHKGISKKKSTSITVIVEKHRFKTWTI